MGEPRHDYRYTDRDVREDPRLTQLAMAYLANYGGDFEPLVRAKLYLRQHEELTTVLVRTTLNCMRFDVHVAHELPVPQPPVLRVVESIEGTVFSPRFRPHEVVKRRRFPFELNVTWKRDYIAATARNATAYHLLDPVRSIAKYYPEAPIDRRFQFEPRTYCNQHLSTGVLLVEPPRDRHLCGQCMRIKTEYEARASAQAIIERELRRGSDD